MIENVNLKAFKKEPAVYYFESNGEVIYVGSSNNLYQRMTKHKTEIKKGSNSESNPALYDFLKNNSFTIHFAYTNDYKQEEQKLINQYQPKYNSNRAFAGIAFNGNKAEYHKEYKEKFKKEIKRYNKQYYEEHKEEKNQCSKQYYEEHKEKAKQRYQKYKEEISKQKKQYNHQKCLYKGETLSFHALSQRLRRKGIKQSTVEAKKYLKEVNREVLNETK